MAAWPGLVFEELILVVPEVPIARGLELAIKSFGLPRDHYG